MTIPSALTRQWELQLALNSPMAVATSLSLKKLPYLRKHMKKACTRLKKACFSATWKSPV